MTALGGIPTWGNVGDATAIAGQMMSLVQSYAVDLEQAAANIVPPSISPTFPTIPSPPTEHKVGAPALQQVTWGVPLQPAPFSGSLNITQYLPGPFTGIAPTLNFGAAPQSFSGQTPPAPPINFNYEYPTVAINLPDVPALLSIKDLQFTPIDIPTFEGVIPPFTLLAPSIVAYNEKAFYTSTELSLVQAEIASALTDDTDIGLSASVQQAMWDAARERELRAQADAIAALERDIETLGYALPPGAFIDSRLKIYNETQYTTAGLSRDIMVKQAELRLENVTKSRELAVQLEGQLITYYNAICQRQFDAAKYVTDAQVAIYNGQVQAYAAQIEGYKASIEAFNAAIRGLELYIEQLKAEVSFEQTKAEINTALVNQYKVQVDAALANLEIFKTQAEIIQIQASVEKIKVDVFSAQIQAYVGQVNAYTAQVEGYKAGIEAQTAIENVYKTQVEAYSIEVEAGVKQAEALIEQYKGQIEAYTAQLEAYKASLQAQVSLAQSQNLYNTSEVELYKGEVSGVSAYNQALTSQWEAIVNEQVQIAGVAVKAAEANAQMYISARGLSLDAAKVGAQVMAQLGAAALNTIHWMNSSSWSLSDSLSVSQSNSTSTSTNTNYNSSV